MTKWVITFLIVAMIATAISNCATRTVSRARDVRTIRTRVID